MTRNMIDSLRFVRKSGLETEPGGHIRLGLLQLTAREDKRVALHVIGLNRLEDCDAPGAERHAMLLASLHSFGGHNPKFVLQIDFTPT